MSKYEHRRDWLLERINKEPYQYIFTSGAVADEFSERFGLSLNVYTVGCNNCPAMTRTLRRMASEGLVVKSTGGNQDAAAYQQKTYYTSYRLTKKPRSN